MKVHLWSELAFYGPGRRSRFDIPLTGPTPLPEVIRRIGAPWPDVGVVALNGEMVRQEDPQPLVVDDDRLDLFPPSSGG